MNWEGKFFIEDFIRVSDMGYPIWWDTTLTIYNQFKDPVTRVVTWYRTVVGGSFWKYTGNKRILLFVEYLRMTSSWKDMCGKPYPMTRRVTSLH